MPRTSDAEEAAEELSEIATESRDTVLNFIEEQPLTAILASFVIGILVGRIVL